jgi:hypothetical protein
LRDAWAIQVREGVRSSPLDLEVAVRSTLITLSLWMGIGLRAMAADSVPSTPPTQVALSEVELPEVAASVEEPPRDKPSFSAKITLDNALGSGVLESNAYSQNPSYTVNLFFNPSYDFSIGGHKLKAAAWEGLFLYPRLDNNAGVSRRVDWSDLRLTLSDSKLYEEPHTHIKLGASLRGTIPVSYTSRFASLITALTFGVNLSKSFYRLDLTAGFAVQKNFFRYTSIQVPCTDPVPIQLPSGGTVLGFPDGICRTGDPSAPVTSATALNANFTLIPSVSGTYHFTDKLSLGVSLTYLDSFLYQVPVDGFSSGAVDSNGNQIAQSQGRVDAIYAITSLDYSIDQHWGLSLGVLNNTAPRSPNAQGYNFPIADVTSLATNSFVFFFDVNASI